MMNKDRMTSARRLILTATLLFSCAATAARGGETAPADHFGLLVTAHGGSPEWNQAILDAVEPLRSQYPLAVAFGMADACSIQAGVRSLEAQGARKIGVLRLFISGDSFREATEQILGLRDGAPRLPEAERGCRENHPASHHSMASFRIDTQSSFVLSSQGLAQAPEIGPILAERASALSRQPEKEDVLVLAHGPAEDAENERWIRDIDARAEAIRQIHPFHLVRVMTLREDWPDKREASEQQIRAFVEKAGREGRQVIVIPFRLYGFGPYAEVLKGLQHRDDQRGLLPHLNVTQWLSRQAEELRGQRMIGTKETSTP